MNVLNPFNPPEFIMNLLSPLDLGLLNPMDLVVYVNVDRLPAILWAIIGLKKNQPPNRYKSFKLKYLK